MRKQRYWEYTTEELPTNRNQALDVMKVLSKYGWELVGVDLGIAYFKREIEASEMESPAMIMAEERMSRTQDY